LEVPTIPEFTAILGVIEDQVRRLADADLGRNRLDASWI
jgi:hypothetical protein